MLGGEKEWYKTNDEWQRVIGKGSGMLSSKKKTVRKLAYRYSSEKTNDECQRVVGKGSGTLDREKKTVRKLAYRYSQWYR